MKNVHTEHCCIIHGCKYGDNDCPVATGHQHQTYLCEWCGIDQVGNTVGGKELIKDTFALVNKKNKETEQDFYGKIDWD